MTEEKGITRVGKDLLQTKALISGQRRADRRIFIDLDARPRHIAIAVGKPRPYLRTRVAASSTWRSIMRGGAHARNLDGPIGQSLQVMTLITPPKAGP